MPVSKQKKVQILDLLQDRLNKAKALVFVSNKGLMAATAAEIRKECRKLGLDYQVAKKTLIKVAAEKKGIKLDNSFFQGSIGIIFGYNDEIAPAKVAYKFSKDAKAKMVITGGIIDGNINDNSAIIHLAKLPSREQLLAMLLSSLNAPISGFVNVCVGPVRGFVQILSAIAKK